MCSVFQQPQVHCSHYGNISVLQAKFGEMNNISDVQEWVQNRQSSMNKGTTITLI